MGVVIDVAAHVVGLDVDDDAVDVATTTSFDVVSPVVVAAATIVVDAVATTA